MRTLQFTIADRLRKARESAGFSQQMLAERMEISNQTVSRYEQGKVRPVRRTVRAWAAVCEVDFEWLWAARDSNPEPRESRPQLRAA